MSTQTISNECSSTIKNISPEINNTYEKLKKCLYPDLFVSSNNNNNGNINSK